MKKLLSAMLVLVLTLLFACCGEDAKQNEKKLTENQQSEIEEPCISIPDFSYAEESAIYREGEPGVKTSGFVNTDDMQTVVNLDSVTEIAKKECTVDSNNLRVYQDTAHGIWKVVFFTDGIVGGGQTVYLNSSGRTLLIVYGE